jgi:hypothetical protein
MWWRWRMSEKDHINGDDRAKGWILQERDDKKRR